MLDPCCAAMITSHESFLDPLHVIKKVINQIESKSTVCSICVGKAGTCVWISSLMDLLASCFFFTASSSTRGLMVIPYRQHEKRVQLWFRSTKTPREDESTRCRTVIKNSSSVIKMVTVLDRSESESTSSVKSHFYVGNFPLLQQPLGRVSKVSCKLVSYDC